MRYYTVRTTMTWEDLVHAIGVEDQELYVKWLASVVMPSQSLAKGTSWPYVYFYAFASSSACLSIYAQLNAPGPDRYT